MKRNKNALIYNKLITEQNLSQLKKKKVYLHLKSSCFKITKSNIYYVLF